MQKRAQAIFEIVVANAFWGMGFVAVPWALQSLSPPAIVFYRFIFAALISGLVLFYSKTSWQTFSQLAKLGLKPGIWLGITMIFQTWGLQYTTPAKSAFITVLYVIIVPLIESFTQRKRLSPIHWLACLIALAGIGLMTELDELRVNIGDLLTLICSFAAAFHILAVETATRKTSEAGLLNGFQSLWSGLLALSLLPFFDGWNILTVTPISWLGLGFLIIGSTVIGFYLQMRAQQYLPAHTAAILFLLESPFSAVFSVVLLDEKIRLSQGFGAVFILLGCWLAIAKKS